MVGQARVPASLLLRQALTSSVCPCGGRPLLPFKEKTMPARSLRGRTG